MNESSYCFSCEECLGNSCPLQSTAGPLTTNTKCSSLEELRGVLKGATNAIPVGWSMVEDDNQFGVLLIMVKVSALEMKTAGLVPRSHTASLYIVTLLTLYMCKKISWKLAGQLYSNTCPHQFQNLLFRV